MKATFENTVNVLVKSYINDTLLHGDCRACAVGNLVANGIGCRVEVLDSERGMYTPVKWKKKNSSTDVETRWDEVFLTCNGQQDQDPEYYKGEAKEQIDSTSYSWQDLAKIEKAFESVAYTKFNSDQHMLDGLMAVVDVLAEIHSIDLKAKEEAKLLFVKA